MNPRICICCGEPMAENNHGLSRNPNVCASCSSMADGMAERNLREAPEPQLDSPILIEASPPLEAEPRPEVVVDWTSGRLLRRE